MKKAHFHYRQAIDLGGSSHTSLGRALLEMGKTREAIDCFTTSISSTRSVQALFWKGNAHRGIGEIDEAVRCYLTALDVHQEDAEACQALAEVYLEEKNDPAAALVWFDKMFALPDTTSAKGYCRTRTPFAAYFCERYPKSSMKAKAFESLCALRRSIMEVKEALACDNGGAAIHYTSLDTSKALVIDTSPFRLHRADRMNDPSEGDIIRSAIGQNIVEEFLDLDPAEELPSAYIGSFVIRSEDQSVESVAADDHLLHWRLYGKSGGVEASGACLVYPCKIFSQRWNTHETASLYHSQGLLSVPTVTRYVPRWQAVTPSLYKVAYEGAGADPLVETMRPLLHHLAELKLAVSSNEEKFVLSNCVRILLEEIRYLFKSRQFEYEREARIVVTVWPNDPGIVVKQSSRAEYVELGQKVYPAEVVLGPCATDNPFSATGGQHGRVMVRKSAISYNL